MNETRRMDRSPATPPPAVRRNSTRAFIVIACSVVLALLLLVVVINIDTPAEPSAQRGADDDVIELVPAPSTLTPEEERRYAGAGEDVNAAIETRLPQGGWIQMQDDTGRIGQRYRFTRQEPRPDGWYWLEKPEAHVFLSDTEAVTLTGDETLAYAPNQALEQGTLTGNVVIRVYSLDDRRLVNPQTDTPTIIVRTTEATFDNVLGEVRCPGPLQLDAPGKAELRGEHLSMRINDLDDRLEMLELASVDYIRLIQSPDHSLSTANRTHRTAQPRARLTSTTARQDAPGRTDKPAQFYELSLSDNVVITQGPAEARRMVRGDALSIIFSSETTGLDEAFAAAAPPALCSRPHAHGIDMTRPLSLTAFLAVQALAQVDAATGHAVPAPGPNETIITVDGPLRILPVDDVRRQLDSPGDARFEVTGAPVELIDDAESAVATAAVLRYDTHDRQVQLIASADHPVAIDSPRLTAGGDRFWLAQDTGEAGFEGQGWLVPQQDQTTPADPTDPDAVAELLEELRVSWTRSVRIDFQPGADDESLGPIERVRFLGEVNIDSPDGAIRCDMLDLIVTQDAEGKPTPEKMHATGNVRTADEERTLWADELIVEFLTDADAAGEDESQRVAVRRVSATGDIQIRMADGSRAFADRLEGDGINETLELTGDNIVIAAGRLLIEKGTSLTLRKDQRSAFWDKGGSLRVFNRAIDTGADHRIDRPVINNDATPPVVRARWDDGLQYDHSVNDGAGAVELRGNVNAESSREPTEHNTMKGDAVTLEFASDSAVETAAAAASDDDLPDLEDRRLARFIARGDASIESRTWKTPQRADKPRIFYAAGPYIEYNDLTFESRIIGDGTLLIRDEWIDADDKPRADIVAPGRRTADNPTFSGKGITQFKFNRELHMQRLFEDRYRIEMTGDVAVVHESLAGDIATMTGQSLAAVVTRADDTRQRTDGLDLGGAMDLRRIEGHGGVLVRTPTRTVECDAFEYNVDSSLARVAAAAGRHITVLTEGTPYPLQAGEVLWNMATDSITIISGAGAGAATP